MLIATSVLKPRQTRIALPGPLNVTGRTVLVRSLLFASIGATTTALFALVVLKAKFFQLLMPGALGGTAGYVLANYSPLKGETFGKWLALKLANLRTPTKLRGAKADLYIGIAPVPLDQVGPFEIFPGAITISAGEVDERGVFHKRYESDVPKLGIRQDRKPLANSPAPTLTSPPVPTAMNPPRWYRPEKARTGPTQPQ